MASEALVWKQSEPNLERYNHANRPEGMNHFGFKGYPDNSFFNAKKPIVAPPSADVTDVSHFFRKDTPTQRIAPDHQPPPSPMKQSQEPPAWLQSRAPPSPPPQQHFDSGNLPPTLSPRYNEYQPPPLRPSDSPVIRDPHGQLSSADRRKKVQEAHVAHENFAEDLRRKEAMKEAKREEQKKPIQYEERGRSPMRERPESFSYGRDRNNDEFDRSMTMPVDRPSSERYRPRDVSKSANFYARLRTYDKQSLHRLLADQERDIGRLQTEINKLKEQRAQESFREPPMFGGNGVRAHSEPLTDRPYRQGGGLFPEENLGATPRRRPGDLFQTNSTYQKDFDIPFNRHGGRRNLGNPNREGPFMPYWPFQKGGHGAPNVNSSGQRTTHIQGAMNVIGRELSDSARAKRTKNKDMLETLQRQKEDDRVRKLMEKERERQGYVELAGDMRNKMVGFPKYLPNGQMGNHHLPHTMSSMHDRPDFEKMKAYKEFLDGQMQQKQRDTKLAQLESIQQAKQHHHVIEQKFGRDKPGGGNIKGPDLRKVNLDKVIHDYRGTTSYYQKVRMDDENDGENVLEKFKPKVTVNSTHKNLYEFPEGNLKSKYNGGAPYAENATY